MKFPLRFFLFVAIQFLAFAFASSQSVKTCATDILRARLEAESPLLRAKRQAFDQMVNQQSNFWMSMRMAAPLMIPVVVHIVHNNGPENISNTQVQAGIDHLNLAFANLGYYQENDGVDIGIQFCLALRDSAGNASNGITRTFSPLTNLTAETQDSALSN